MKRKQIQILLILSAVAAALAILLAVLSREPAVPETRLLLQSSAPLSTICYTNKDGTVRLEQENGVWRLSGDSAFPVSQQAAQTLAQALLTAPIEQAITPVADASAQYGLEQPQCEIELAFEDGAQHRLLIGSMNAATEQLYVQLDAQTELYLTAPALLQAFSAGLLDLMELPAIPTPDAPQRVELTNAAGTIVLSCVGSETQLEDGVWAIRTENGFAPVESSAAYNLYAICRDLRWRGCAAYRAGKQTLADCGLTEPRAVYTIFYEENGQDASFTLRFGAGLPDGSCYAACGSDGTLYLLDEIAASWLASLHADDLPLQTD